VLNFYNANIEMRTGACAEGPRNTKLVVDSDMVTNWYFTMIQNLVEGDVRLKGAFHTTTLRA